MNRQDQILITIISEGEEHLIETYPNEYRSLMALIKDKLYPDGFGECGGLGRCATCIIRSQQQGIAGMDRNESTTLSKLDIDDPFVRLSCQLLIDANLHHTIIVVLGDT